MDPNRVGSSFGSGPDSRPANLVRLDAALADLCLGLGLDLRLAPPLLSDLPSLGVQGSGNALDLEGGEEGRHCSAPAAR